MESSGRARFARLWIGLIACWILTGAIFKLFWGTPALLPAVVRDVPLELGVTYNLAIGIELAIAAIALVAPGWGWLLQAALLVVFDVVLTTQIAAGDANCGCFGAKFSMPPWLMMAIDSALLVVLIALRPWSARLRGLPVVVPAALAAAALAVPWFLDRQVDTETAAAGTAAPENAWIELDVDNWVGEDIWDTKLGQPPLSEYIDVMQLPLDGLWVFWRADCEHCAKHLGHMKSVETGQRLVTLVRLEQKHDSEANRVVHEMPDGNFVQYASLPPSISYILTTPAELLLEGGKIVAARDDAVPGVELVPEGN